MGRGKESLKMPLNKAQIEILRLLSRDLTEDDLREIKRRIVQYLGEKLDDITDKVWEEKGLRPSDMEEMLDSHHRTSYNKLNLVLDTNVLLASIPKIEVLAPVELEKILLEK